MDTVYRKRSVVSDALDKVRAMLAEAQRPTREGEQPESAAMFAHRIENMLTRRLDVSALEVCTGDSHPHGDNCSVCSPRWGVTGPKVHAR